MSIATEAGDAGHTGLIGGERVSKGHPRVEAYGTVDELNSFLGFARAICDDEEIRELVKRIQKELFSVSGAIANPRAREKQPPYVTDEMVQWLTEQVHRIEGIEGILSDWSLPGEHAAAAAFDIARTVCRRAERHIVRLHDSGAEITLATLAYLNRLSDLLWLIGRLLEQRAGINAALRQDGQKGPRWSRAW